MTNKTATFSYSKTSIIRSIKFNSLSLSGRNLYSSEIEKSITSAVNIFRNINMYNLILGYYFDQKKIESKLNLMLYSINLQINWYNVINEICSVTFDRRACDVIDRNENSNDSVRIYVGYRPFHNA